jgi:gas vesicle protein
MNSKISENETAKSNSLKKTKSNIKKNSLMNTGKTVLGILAGIGLGALIGIVFAPQKGSKTRRKMVKKGERYLEDMKNQFDDFLSDAAERIDKIGEVKDHFVADEKNTLNDAKNGIKTALT